MGTRSLSDQLRAHRRSLNIGTAEAGARCAVSQSTFSKWENGIIEVPVERYAAVAQFLGLTRAEVALIQSGDDPTIVTEWQQLRDQVPALEAKAAEMEAKAAEMEAQLRRLETVPPDEVPPGTGRDAPEASDPSP